MFFNGRILPTASIFLLAVSALAGENRVVLIDQSDWNGHKGFYLDIENQGPDGTPLRIETARLILAVGDGQGWRFLVTNGPFATNHFVRVEFEITPAHASLTVDGKIVGNSPGGFAPVRKQTTLADNPSWAKSPASYRIEQSIYLLGTGGSNWAGETQPSSSVLTLFQEPLPKQITLELEPGQSLAGATSFRVLPEVQKSIDGLVDPYGQVAAAGWGDKVRSDADLKTTSEELRRTQTWRRPSDWDPYGGLKTTPWHEKPAGFYRVLERGDIWWLISPDGNPLFYTGLCTSPALNWEMTPVDGREALFQALPAKAGITAGLWRSTSPWGDGPESYFCPQAWNLVRKFGSGWQQEALSEFRRRMDGWAFSGQGKWAEKVPGLARIVVLPLDAPRLVRHPDVFDEAVRAKIRQSLAGQIEPIRNDPWVLGMTVGSEFDEIVTTDEVSSILKDHPDSPAAKAILKAVGDGKIEAARQFYARSYYECLYRTVKSLDPNHLYLGNWIVPGWWQNDSDWNLIAPYCDVIGYDRYAPTYSGIEDLLARFDKPTFAGEFSHPAWYGGTRGYGRYEQSYVETDSDSGRRYADWIGAASRDPKCVGATWFQYRDEPVTGRGPGKGPEPVLGEHYAFGFVDVTDRPKWDLVTQARKANLAATPARLRIHR